MLDGEFPGLETTDITRQWATLLSNPLFTNQKDTPKTRNSGLGKIMEFTQKTLMKDRPTDVAIYGFVYGKMTAFVDRQGGGLTDAKALLRLKVICRLASCDNSHSANRLRLLVLGAPMG